MRIIVWDYRPIFQHCDWFKRAKNILRREYLELEGGGNLTGMYERID